MPSQHSRVVTVCIATRFNCVRSDPAWLGSRSRSRDRDPFPIAFPRALVPPLPRHGGNHRPGVRKWIYQWMLRRALPYLSLLLIDPVPLIRSPMTCLTRGAVSITMTSDGSSAVESLLKKRNLTKQDLWKAVEERKARGAFPHSTGADDDVITRILEILPSPIEERQRGESLIKQL
ncbi:unnamed protein product [Leuciscus chuanchicus]